MNAFATLESLVKPRLLEGIPEHDKNLIMGVAEHQTVHAKGTIIQGGDTASALFLLREGRAKYFRLTDKGEEILLWWLTPGDVFGLATILSQPPGYIGTVEAVADCKLMVWEHSSVLSLSRVYPQISRNALRITLAYLAAYCERHASVTSRTARERLAQTLLQLGHRAGRTLPSGVEIAITNEQLGGLADVGVFTTSRLLSEWERKGAVTKNRGCVRIHAPERLLTP